MVQTLTGVGVSSVAFDREGRRLLIGGINPDEHDEHQDGRARVWDLGTGVVQATGKPSGRWSSSTMADHSNWS